MKPSPFAIEQIHEHSVAASDQLRDWAKELISQNEEWYLAATTRNCHTPMELLLFLNQIEPNKIFHENDRTAVP